MNRKILIAALVCGIGAFVALKYCCPKSTTEPTIVGPVVTGSTEPFSSPALSVIRDDIVAAGTVRPLGLREFLDWSKALDKSKSRPGFESLVVWLRDRLEGVKGLQLASESFAEVVIAVSPKIVATTTGYKFPVFGSVWAHANESEAIKLEKKTLEAKGGKFEGAFTIGNSVNGVHEVTIPFKNSGTASGKLWRKGSSVFLVVGGEPSDLFTDSASQNSRFADLSASSVSNPLITFQFDGPGLRSVIDSIEGSLLQLGAGVGGIEQQLAQYSKAGPVMMSVGVTGTNIRSRVCASNLGIDMSAAPKADSSRFGNLLGDGTVLAYRADARAINKFLDSVLMMSDTVQSQQAEQGIPGAAVTELAVQAKRGEDLVRIIQMLLPPKAEAGVVVEMPIGGFTPMVMGYLRADNFDAEEFLRSGATEINARITQNFGDYRLTAKSFERDRVPYINFFMDGTSQPVFIRAAGSDGLAVGISEVAVDQAVARLISGKNTLINYRDYKGVTVWDRILASPSSTFFNFSPVVRILRPFLPFVVGDGQRLPPGISPEDIDYIVQNLTFRILGTGSGFKLAGSECRESLWEILPE